nr:uncharacterized mitochondrial protein AtMg00810-like [Tanacetum cinerariifolium]
MVVMMTSGGGVLVKAVAVGVVVVRQRPVVLLHVENLVDRATRNNIWGSSKNSSEKSPAAAAGGLVVVRDRVLFCSSHDDESKPSSDDGKKIDEDPRKENECNDQEKKDNINNTNNVNTICLIVNTAGTNKDNELPLDPNMLALEDISTFDFTGYDEENVAMADMNNLDTTIQVSPTPTTRIHKDHPLDQMSSMGELTFFLGLQVKQKKDGIFICQDKYVYEILKKIEFTKVKTSNTPMETQNPLLKDEDGEEVDIHMYRSMIGSLMYLTSLRPDIMFAVCACVRYQFNPKVSHLYAVKRIFRYLKGQLKLGLWYLKDSPFDLVPYTDSDYACASLDRKSKIGGCQYLGFRLISWQFKKQTVVANSIT